MKAIHENENIDIQFHEENETIIFHSRFFCLDSDSDSIIIDYPFIEGKVELSLGKDDSVNVEFNCAGYRFHFKSKIVTQIFIDIGQGKTIPALKMEWPAEIDEFNRRNLYRLALHVDESIKVRYSKIDAPPLGLLKRLKKHECRGIEELMFDLSENGIAVKINREINVQVGDMLAISFQLGTEDEVSVEGIVTNIRQYPRSHIHVCGIMFSGKRSAKYRKNLRKIARFVVARNSEKIRFLLKKRGSTTYNPVVQKIVGGEATEPLIEMLLNQEFPLNQEEYLESLVHILQYERFTSRAMTLLRNVSSSTKEKYIMKPEANHRVAHFILDEALRESNKKIIAALVCNQSLPVDFLHRIAREGSPRLLSLLFTNPVKLAGYPEVLDFMENNNNATPALCRRIADFRKSNLIALRQETFNEKELSKIIGELSNGERSNWIRQFQGMDKKIEQVVLSQIEKLNDLSLSKRIRLALIGNPLERMILARDPNVLVVRAVIENPYTTESEILNLVRNKKTQKDIIEGLCNNPIWLKSKDVLKCLLTHPEISHCNITHLLGHLEYHDWMTIRNEADIHPKIRKQVQSYFASSPQ